jgi:hypothetical protein
MGAKCFDDKDVGVDQTQKSVYRTFPSTHKRRTIWFKGHSSTTQTRQNLIITSALSDPGEIIMCADKNGDKVSENRKWGRGGRYPHQGCTTTVQTNL